MRVLVTKPLGLSRHRNAIKTKRILRWLWIHKRGILDLVLFILEVLAKIKFGG